MDYFVKKTADDNYVILPEYGGKYVKKADGTLERQYVKRSLKDNKLHEEPCDIMLCGITYELVRWNTERVRELLQDVEIGNAIKLHK